MTALTGLAVFGGAIVACLVIIVAIAKAMTG